MFQNQWEPSKEAWWIRVRGLKDVRLPVTTESQGGSGRWVGGWVGGGVRSLPVATVKLLVAMDKLTGRGALR